MSPRPGNSRKVEGPIFLNYHLAVAIVLWQSLCDSVAKSLWLCGLQHARLPCPLLSPGVCPNSCPLSQWCYLIISSSAAPFSFRLLLGARVRHSARGKGHEEGGSTYAKAGSSLRSPPGNPRASTPITRACLLYYFVFPPTPLTLWGAVPHHLFRRRS